VAAKRNPPKEAEKPAAARRRRVQSDFPKHSVEDAIRVAAAIEEANGGSPYPPTDAAIALSISPGSSEWRALTGSSFKYGLTAGTYKSDRLEITPLGQRIVAPTSEADRTAALFTAVLLPGTFKSIFEQFKGKKVPVANFFENTVVRDFDVPKEHAAICVEVFTKNAQFAGLTRTTPTGQWLGTEPSGLPAASATDVPHGDDGDAEGEAQTGEEAPPSPPDPEPPKRGGGKAIFVGHGKNKKPLEQLQKILNEYGVPHKVAIDEPNSGRPISEKVAQVMGECGAAILIFTADEEFRSLDDDVVWRPSENVVYELGASAVLYGRRIIIFKEKDVTFPSNFRDIGYISFDNDALDAKGVDLFRELVAFKIIEVSVKS
jgi:CAP12/Pycsar effector protein, TIR domain